MMIMTMMMVVMEMVTAVVSDANDGVAVLLRVAGPGGWHSAVECGRQQGR